VKSREKAKGKDKEIKRNEVIEGRVGERLSPKDLFSFSLLPWPSSFPSLLLQLLKVVNKETHTHD